MRRQVEEMKGAGMSEAEIRAREAEIRANAHESTLQSLKEFFLLSKIAEAEEIKVEDEDVEAEIYSIAARTDETPRRVRSRIEKEGLGEGLASQILERKTIDRILEFTSIEDVAPEAEAKAVETLDETATAADFEGEEEPAAPEAEAEPEAGGLNRRSETEIAATKTRPLLSRHPRPRSQIPRPSARPLPWRSYNVLATRNSVRARPGATLATPFSAPTSRPTRTAPCFWTPL